MVKVFQFECRYTSSVGISLGSCIHMVVTRANPPGQKDYYTFSKKSIPRIIAFK